jgi:hypothetical protein
MTASEKRRYERYGLELPVAVKWKDALGNAKEETGTTIDMSRSGMFMICTSPIDEGSEIDVEIDLTTSAGSGIKSCVSVGGKIVRNIPLKNLHGGYGHAIMFDAYRFVGP